MTRARGRSMLLAASLCIVTLLIPTAGASAAESQTHSNLCPRGQNACVDAVIREMRRRFSPLASSCDHDAVFALAYLRTTQEYRRAVSDPNFFDDNAFVNREDAIFADAYFRAYDAWHKRRGSVPPAWQVAFDAADRRAVSGSGSLLLGMNAHINRDLPFVLAQIGLVAPDGTSRKPDHDRVNDILARVVEPVIAEAALRFDPTIDDTSVDGTGLDETATLQLVVGWREVAWRNAERLVAARTSAERALVARSIEDAAAAEGRLLAQQYAYLPPLTGPAQRDAWCAEHWDDRP